jgi:hypothetical protein
MKKLLIALTLISLGAQAEPSRLEELNEQIKNLGFKPEGGLSIVPSSALTQSQSIKNGWIGDDMEQSRKGYYLKADPRANYLMNFTDMVKKNRQLKPVVPSQPISADSDLKENLSEVTMAYQFTSVPNPELVYGYAGAGSYDNGWSSIVEFFKYKNIGNCAFTENNIAFSHSSEKLDEEAVTREINEKATLLDIHGTKAAGYLYSVHWADDNYFRDLECATSNYDNTITQSVIDLAILIDSRL